MRAQTRSKLMDGMGVSAYGAIGKGFFEEKLLGVGKRCVFARAKAFQTAGAHHRDTEGNRGHGGDFGLRSADFGLWGMNRRGAEYDHLLFSPSDLLTRLPIPA